MFVIRTDNNAQPKWMKTYGTPFGNSMGLRVVSLLGDAYIAVGSSDVGGPGSNDGYIMNFDGDGNILNQLLIGNQFYDDGRFFRITNSYIIFGGLAGSTSGPNRSNIFIEAIDPGTLQPFWSKTYGGDTSSGLNFLNIDPVDGNLDVGGYRDYPGKGSQNIVFKLDINTGDVMWSKIFGETGDEYMEGGTVLSDGSMVVTGETNETSGGPANNAWVARLSPTGELCGADDFGLVVRDLIDSLTGPSISVLRDSVVAFPFNQTALTENSYSPTVIDHCLSTGIHNNASKTKSVSIYPNPTNGLLTIQSSSPWLNPVKVTVYNLIGSVVTNKVVAANTSVFNLDITGQASGMYIISFNDGNTISTQKITLK